uniref:hypothetical protein n=1 Tax=uncultured Micrococcus sp. TaxID=114051 RepID=UPI002618F6E3|nr:hypothetical protein [uncultured Micrococcus sp.]
MIESLQDFTESLPPLLQWLGVMVAGAIPFVESYFGSVIGVIAGIAPPVAILAAVLGNIASMLAIVLGADAIRNRTARPQKEPSSRRLKLRRAFDKYGVAGVSLLGQTILPSQITSMAMVSFGAPKNAVILWQTISIILWGTAFGVLATLGINFLATA